jgi:hypothetical protein
MGESDGRGLASKRAERWRFYAWQVQMNELTDKIWSGIEARLVDIKRALTDQTEETKRYVFAVPKTRIESLRGRFRKFTPENLFELALNQDEAEVSEHVMDGLKMPYKIEFRGASCRFPKPRIEADCTTRGGIFIWNEKPIFPMGLRCAFRSSVRYDMEERLVDIKHASTDLIEETQRYVFEVPQSRIESLRKRFPKFTPENLFEQALNEDKAEICEHVLDGLKMPYKIEFRGARCWLPIPRPEVDYATRGGIGIWSEKPCFPMGLRNR